MKVVIRAANRKFYFLKDNLILSNSSLTSTACKARKVSFHNSKSATELMKDIFA